MKYAVRVGGALMVLAVGWSSAIRQQPVASRFPPTPRSGFPQLATARSAQPQTSSQMPVMSANKYRLAPSQQPQDALGPEVARHVRAGISQQSPQPQYSPPPPPPPRFALPPPPSPPSSYSSPPPSPPSSYSSPPPSLPRSRPMVQPQVQGPLKPFISEVCKPHLFNFFEDPEPYLSCFDLNDQLGENEATHQAHLHLTVILDALEPDKHPKHESITNDKNCMNSLNLLNSLMISDDGHSGDSSSGDLVNHIEKIIRCKVDMYTGRGILQKVVENGMEKSLKTFFMFTLLKGAANYDPSLVLDKKGNNLLHLAVLSNAYNIVPALFDLENQRNAEDPLGRLNGVYWLLSALMSKNHEGKRPLELCSSHAVKDQLKRYFRALTTYMHIVLRRRGITDNSLNRVDELLQTSGSVAPIAPAA